MILGVEKSPLRRKKQMLFSHPQQALENYSPARLISLDVKEEDVDKTNAPIYSRLALLLSIFDCF